MSFSHPVYRAAEAIVRAWVTLYLAGVPQQARGRRRAEIASDLHEHRRDALAQGRSPAIAALRLLVRCIAGSLDDLLWRSEVNGALKGNTVLRIVRTPGPGRVALATAVILLLPLSATQLTDDMAWTLFDFALAGVFLFGAGLTFDLIVKRSGDIAYRIAVALAVGAPLLLVWVNLAVGIIGSEDNPANLMYFGVIAVAIIGATLARYQPRGMAYAMVAAALAQGLVAAIALIALEVSAGFWGETLPVGAPAPLVQLLGVNAMFVGLFLEAASLFWTAARGQTGATAAVPNA